jgi:hypothetical protein
MLSLTFRQAQCGFAHGQSEPVEDCALAITKKIEQYLNRFQISPINYWNKCYYCICNL